MLATTLLALVPSLPAATASEEPRPVAAAIPAAPDDAEVQQALKRASAQLVGAREAYEPKSGDARRKDGSKPKAAKREWPYEGVYRVDGDIPIGYRIGGTSIVATALIEAAGGKIAGETRDAVVDALGFVLENLGDPRMSTEFEKGYDVRGWGHAYALEFLLRARREKGLVPEKRASEVAQAVDDLVARLQRTEIGGRGGWNYSRPQGDDSDASTFMTAPTLLFLFEARRQGVDVDPVVVERALKSLEDARLETGAFQYGSDKSAQNGRGFEDVPGAVGRMAVCEVALHLAGRGSVERIRGSIAAFFEHWEWLEKRRKQTGTHVPPYMIAPYYFFYAHRYVAQAIEFLPEAERAGNRARLRALLWKVREEEGGWNDRVFPRSVSFGTAMTVLALLEPTLARPAGWTPPPPEGR